ncbi:substrate-binding domain-containing protein [Aeribacillus pallidus]|jgi:ABC-type branched-chain amino acid transport systems, periplasmic component|uniref:ABC transporter permease n=1 Tax=Aeribacillus pallidus TaxID=33936 RepID=A0A165X2Y2_9BACI|nr:MULTISPECIES: substrate-binding domain-containing protein [Aeribacillus]ASS88903.1 ABC transporter permease [Aeribacillus pallidus]KZM55501.1 ABC transporter permease [Aeribacillus pallidus]KZN95569.1 ABC transporter permease [Aeribacillus pallidus]MED0651987.1 substrate-binding domain-containing protein [Aeribacillus composti]MED4486762.1 substrate-binding domain-containing protein [Aeribacillus pallidus]
MFNKKKAVLKSFLITCVIGSLLLTSACGSDSSSSEEEKDTIKIGVLASLTGALEAYGKQTVRGFELGLDYATDGTGEVVGKKIKFIVEDTETKPDVAVKKATKLLEEDEVDFLVGSTSSSDTLAVLPLAKEYKRIMIVEPAAADSITGDNFNPYIFRTGRNSSQDAVAGAAAIAKEGVRIATLAQDNAYGRDGIAAFIEAAKERSAEIVAEVYADPNATDFTANIQSAISEKPDYLYIVWAGSNAPWKQLKDMKVQEKGIKISTAVQDIASLKTMDALIGMEGYSIYYHTLPDNEINDWLVEEHKKRFDGEIPDLFTAGGMTAAIAIVEALKKTEGDTDAQLLIETMEGMEFDSPKGKMKFREEDHQALQSLYSITLENQEGVDHPVPVLIRELDMNETEPPIRNQ